MDNGYTLDPGEKVLRTIHRSFFSFVPALAMSIFLAAFAIVFTYLDARYPASIPFPPIVVFPIVAIVAVLSVIIFLIGWYVFRRNILVFTNLHLIEVEQYGLFNRSVSQVSFTRVQDVTGTRTGFFATIFNYGDVEVQSAGEEQQFIFHYAHDPEAVANAALLTHEQFMRDQAASGVGPQAE
jgi:uncharacterized membrane protein YdbT with pleckstrin-like domain